MESPLGLVLGRIQSWCYLSKRLINLLIKCLGEHIVKEMRERQKRILYLYISGAIKMH